MEWIRRLIKAIRIAAHILRNVTQICCSYRPLSHFIEFSLDCGPQVLCWLQIQTEDRPWHHSYIVLMEKVPGCSDSVGAGIVLLEHVMPVTAKIGHNVKLKDLMDIPQSRDAITSTWANILKDNRSRLIPMFPKPWCSVHPMCFSLHHTCICVTSTSSSPDPYSAIRRRNTELTII